MAEGAVRLPPDSTGTRLRTVTNAGVASGAHQEVVTLAAADGTLVAPATQTTLEAIRVLLEATLSVAGSVGLDAPTLAALETVNVGNFPASQAVTGPLTDSQLRAVPVPVSFPADEAGLTDDELRASPVPVSGTVTVANPTANPETGLAKDTNLLALLGEFRNRYDVVSTARATYTTSGNHTLIAPPPGQALRTVWLYAQARGELDTGTVLVTFTLGGNSYEVELTGSQPFAHGAVWEGAADQPLIVATSSTAAVLINVDYRTFAP